MFRVPFLFQSIDASSSNRFATTGTERTGLLMVVNFTIWFACKFEETSSSEGFLAISTCEMFRVPLRSQSIDAVTAYGFVTTSTLWRKERIEVGFAIGSTISLEKVASSKRLQTLGTYEMVCVPFLSQGSNATVKHRFIAVATFRTKHLLETSLTVWHSVLFIEIASAQWISAIAA